MNKILKSTLFATVLSSTLMAEVLFDLGAQQLSESQAGTYKLSSYDLGKSIVSTGMASGADGAYRPKRQGSGSITAQIKEPKANWGVTFNMYCYLNNDGCGATLIGANGNTINIALSYNSISVEGNKSTYTNFYNAENIYGSVQTIQDSDEIEIIINGAYKYRVTKPNFKVAQVALSVGTEGSATDYHIDKVTSLVISASDD
jgi:hypothetical protein